MKNVTTFFTWDTVPHLLTVFTLSEIRPCHLFTSERTNKFKQGFEPGLNFLTGFTSCIYQNPLA